MCFSVPLGHREINEIEHVVKGQDIFTVNAGVSDSVSSNACCVKLSLMCDSQVDTLYFSP